MLLSTLSKSRAALPGRRVSSVAMCSAVRAVCPQGQTAVAGGWYLWTYNAGIAPAMSGQCYTNTPGDSAGTGRFAESTCAILATPARLSRAANQRGSRAARSARNVSRVSVRPGRSAVRPLRVRGR